MAKKRINQKQQKNLVALASGVVGVGAVALSTYPQWKEPAALATDTYAKFHDKVGDFITFMGLGNGALVVIGIVGIGIAALMFRK